MFEKILDYTVEPYSSDLLGLLYFAVIQRYMYSECILEIGLLLFDSICPAMFVQVSI